MPRRSLIQLRRGTAAEWAATTEPLRDGEPGVVLDDGSLLIGTNSGSNVVGSTSDLMARQIVDGYSINPRIITGTGSLASGTASFQHFMLPSSLTVSSLTFFSGSTPAGATPTLVKYGLYQVHDDGSATRLGLTANDTTIFNAATWDYKLDLLDPVVLQPGVIYAAAILIISAATMPNVAAASSNTALIKIPPVLARARAGQTDLEASYPASGWSNQFWRAHVLLHI